MNKKDFKNRNDDLFNAVLKLETAEEAKAFFEDLCTWTELEAISQRYQIAVSLSRGLNYNEILEQIGTSSATISRVNRSLKNGAGGYEIVLSRLADK
ncbi:MAG: TrpR-like protein [Ruminococcaceae bacterium]|nr:TrpR-like protein [Oscillospiraceae bacterium]